MFIILQITLIMGHPLTPKKSVEKNVEKDPFIVTVRNNNAEPSKLTAKAFDDDEPTDGTTTSRLHTMSLIIGIFLMVLGLSCFTAFSHLESVFDHLVQSHTALSAGGEYSVPVSLATNDLDITKTIFQVPCSEHGSPHQ
jgi:hypothetical protein